MTTTMMPTLSRERISIRRHPSVAAIEVKTIESATQLWSVFHERYDLFCSVQGTSERRFRGRGIIRGPGDLMLYEPGDFDANTRLETGSSFHVVSIDARYLASAITAAGGRPELSHFAASDPSSPSLHAAVRRVVAAWSGESGPDGDLLRECELAGLLDVLLSEHLTDVPFRAASGEHASLAAAAAYLHDHAESRVSLDALAAHAKLNKHYLIRLFGQRYGISPHAYHQALRIGRARTLLRDGHRPSELPRRLGFSDLSHLHRAFIKAVGMTPAEYARGEPRVRGGGSRSG